MSGPNTNYDPVQVSALDADQVEARVAEALEAIARASTTAELKQVRITHTGDRSALALANREMKDDGPNAMTPSRCDPIPNSRRSARQSWPSQAAAFCGWLALATSTRLLKALMSETASSASILRSTSTPAFFRPLMKRL